MSDASMTASATGSRREALRAGCFKASRCLPLTVVQERIDEGKAHDNKEQPYSTLGKSIPQAFLKQARSASLISSTSSGSHIAFGANSGMRSPVILKIDRLGYNSNSVTVDWQMFASDGSADDV